MKISCELRKMRTALDGPVTYELPIDPDPLPLNPLIGGQISLRYSGKINCIHCGRETKKSFNQGYCYPCFISLAQCDMCIVKPELCHFDQGTCREPDWGESNCMQAHYVYLANSSGIKVGITRHTQIPTRWIDQGAIQALPILKVQSRFLSGLVEVILKNHVSDRTSWQKMLKNQVEEADLTKKRDELLDLCSVELKEIEKRFGQNSVEYIENDKSISIQYPVLQYPEKVKSLNFDKTADIAGTLVGIKGQYLIFDIGVINVRKFGGYNVEIEC